jgi:hypothetical protein
MLRIDLPGAIIKEYQGRDRDQGNQPADEFIQYGHRVLYSLPQEQINQRNLNAQRRDLASVFPQNADQFIRRSDDVASWSVGYLLSVQGRSLIDIHHGVADADHKDT